MMKIFSDEEFEQIKQLRDIGVGYFKTATIEVHFDQNFRVPFHPATEEQIKNPIIPNAKTIDDELFNQ